MLIKVLSQYLKTSSDKLQQDKENNRIPEIISPNERIVRGLFSHLLVSADRDTIKQNAFLPPPNKNDVSTFRFDYTNPTFCKQKTKEIASNINGQKYQGLGLILALNVQEANQKVNNELQEIVSSNSSISIKATPIDGSGRYRDFKTEIIRTTDEGLPMHADLLYDEIKPQKGKISLKLRLIADYLVDCAKYYKDPHPELEEWKGPEIT
jgi:hypothetical protein